MRDRIPRPVDGCPRCIAGRAAPATAQVDGAALVCRYVCPSCGHRWWTTYNLAALGVALEATPAKPAGRDDQAGDATKALRKGAVPVMVPVILSAALLLVVDILWLKRRLRALARGEAGPRGRV